jgi:hypothetical protein
MDEASRPPLMQPAIWPFTIDPVFNYIELFYNRHAAPLDGCRPVAGRVRAAPFREAPGS